jgi:serine/threonine protein kinase
MIVLGDFLILPFVEFDLEYLLSDQISFKIKAPQIRIIMYQLLSALYYLHSAELVHRDIKPTSVLLGNSHIIITSSQ